MRLDIERGDLRAEEQAPGTARHSEVYQSRFDHRIDDDHLSAAVADVSQRRHEPRMIAGRVAADDEHQVGMLDIFERHGRRAAADRALEAYAARLVAIVAAIVDVVR